MTSPTGVTPVVTNSRLMRDEIIKVAGVPFKRLLVYRLEIALPLPSLTGVTLFEIASGFLISSITTSAAKRFENDAAYVLEDVADGEIIGVVEVRGGEDGLLPMALPELPAGLGGPCRVLIKHLSGVQDRSGSLIIQIAVNGPPNSGNALTIGHETIDLNNDGVPDELAEEILPLPDNVPAQSFDDFMAGYNTGMSGVSTQ